MWGYFLEGKVMTKLTAKELESLDANDAGRVLREDGGLSGKVQLKKKGTAAFYYQFRWEGKFTDISCGHGQVYHCRKYAKYETSPAILWLPE
ncbi:hypothetical protein D3C84_984310 [compost metagenome]|nr:hypothetical protein BSF43_34990 [Pseudomonas ogarae]